MAIMTQRKLSELQRECSEKGLKVIQTGTRVSKTDYINALRDYYLEAEFHGNIPKALDLMLHLESPMLCSRFSEFSPEDKEKLWDSKDYIAEQKEDGCRFVSVFDKGNWNCYSRNISVKDYLPVDYSENMVKDAIDFSKIKDSFMIDSEIISSNPNVSTIMGKHGVVCETQLQSVSALLAMNPEASKQIQIEEDCPLELRVFDVLWWNGEWLINKPLIERIPYVVEAVKQLNGAGVKCRRPYSSYSNKKTFYKVLLSMGCEGVVLKNLYSRYVPSSNRSKEGFIKVKRTMSETMQDEGIADCIDAFVTGYQLGDDDKSWAGLVGSLDFSVYLRKDDGSVVEHKIARVSNLSLDLRHRLTGKDENGNPCLKQEYYGKCAEVDGQCISARSYRLRHARLVQWRNDRTSDTCVIDESFVKSMVL